MKQYSLIMALLTLSACSPTLDMQGVDPKDYYAAHPIKNKVETHSASLKIFFAPGQPRLSEDEADKLSAGLRDISPPAAESVQISFAAGDMSNEERKECLTKLLRVMGYSQHIIRFAPSASVKAGEAKIDISYAAVVSPNCPDWRTSPVTTYSNTWQGNANCAGEVNLGLMVADPRDLVKGTGDVQLDSERDSKVISDYRTGVAPAAAASASGSGGASGSSGGGASSSGSSSGSSSSGGAPTIQ